MYTQALEADGWMETPALPNLTYHTKVSCNLHEDVSCILDHRELLAGHEPGPCCPHPWINNPLGAGCTHWPDGTAPWAMTWLVHL